MLVFQTRTASFSNWGVRIVVFGRCGLAVVVTARASTPRTQDPDRHRSSFSRSIRPGTDDAV
jgi:hypothetical protein